MTASNYVMTLAFSEDDFRMLDLAWSAALSEERRWVDVALGGDSAHQKIAALENVAKWRAASAVVERVRTEMRNAIVRECRRRSRVRKAVVKG